MENVRRVASFKVIKDNTIYERMAIEIVGDKVVNYYSFSTELPMTEWLGGTIELKRNTLGVLQAWKNGDLITQDTED